MIQVCIVFSFPKYKKSKNVYPYLSLILQNRIIILQNRLGVFLSLQIDLNHFNTELFTYMHITRLNKLLLFALLAPFAINNRVCAQNYTIPLWQPGKIPNVTNTKNEREIIVNEEEGYTGIRNVQIPDIKVFLPTRRNATGQAVIICPGGAYSGLAYDLEGVDYAKFLNTFGVAGIVLKYRLPPSGNHATGYQNPISDVQRAIRITRYHARKWDINPDKIGVMGSSAGGHLASTAGTHFDLGRPNSKDSIEAMSSRPDFMILIYPVITFNDPFANDVSRENLIGKNPDKKLADYFSNELHVKEDTPPTFIVHAGNDDAVPVENSLLFYAALRKHRIPVELHIFPEGGHGFGLAVGNEHYGSWPQACQKWLKWLNARY